MQYSVISIHYTTECNLNCSFCYKTRTDKILEKPRKFWIDLLPYAKKLTNQIALGGGEPFIDIPFIKKFGKTCFDNKLIFNVTTNGKILMRLSDKELKSVLKNITMVSISYDNEKIKNIQDIKKYTKLIKRIQNLTECQVGCNFLINKNTFYKKGSFANSISFIFSLGVDRVFVLYPKNLPKIDILKHIDEYAYLDRKFSHFYVDDLTKMIITEKKYDNWKHECHYGKNLISINEQGYVAGCSFDPNNKALCLLKKPKDLFKVKRIKIKNRYSCPYLIR